MDISFILDQTKLLLRTIVNPALSSLKGGTLEIKLTVPLKKKKKLTEYKCDHAQICF